MNNVRAAFRIFDDVVDDGPRLAVVWMASMIQLTERFCILVQQYCMLSHADDRMTLRSVLMLFFHSQNNAAQERQSGGRGGGLGAGYPQLRGIFTYMSEVSSGVTDASPTPDNAKLDKLS